MKKAYLLLTGLLIAVTVTAFAFTSPDGGKDKKASKAEVKKECVGMQSQAGCPGHAGMKASCDQTKCQNPNCDPSKCQGTCDKTKCQGNCTGTCSMAQCTKHTETAKK